MIACIHVCVHAYVAVHSCVHSFVHVCSAKGVVRTVKALLHG